MTRRAKYGKVSAKQSERSWKGSRKHLNREKDPKERRGRANTAVKKDDNCEKRRFIIYSPAPPSFRKYLIVNAKPLTVKAAVRTENRRSNATQE